MEIERGTRRRESMEVMFNGSSIDFNFDSTCSSPYISAPSSPRRFGDFNYFSAPTSPSASSSVFRDFNNFPISHAVEDDNPNIDDDFQFDFSGQLDKASLTADELFEEGKIRPLKPPPCLHLDFPERSPNRSSKSPRSPISKFRSAFSPRHRKHLDPFEAALHEARKDGVERERGREKKASSKASSIHRPSRSLSPLKISNFGWDDQQTVSENQNKSTNQNAVNAKQSFKDSSKKWRLKDFLLFRSASEGRATTKDPLKKYAIVGSSKRVEDIRISSFRSTDGGGSSHGSSKRGPVSLHELHYTTNRAVAEEMKRKTFLPYRQGLLGCLGFDSTLSAFTRGFNSFARN